MFRKDKWLVNMAQVRSYAKEIGLRFSDTAFEPLHGLVQRMLHMAAKQASLKKRKTLEKEDFEFWL